MPTDELKDEAQRDLSLNGHGISPGQVYRHYKGGLYVIVAVSINEHSFEPLVTYRDNKKGTCWTRTMDDFMGYISFNFIEGARPRFRREED